MNAMNGERSTSDGVLAGVDLRVAEVSIACMQKPAATATQCDSTLPLRMATERHEQDLPARNSREAQLLSAYLTHTAAPSMS